MRSQVVVYTAINVVPTSAKNPRSVLVFVTTMLAIVNKVTIWMKFLRNVFFLMNVVSKKIYN